MPFNSLKYLLFLPAVYLVFYLVAERARWMVLLVASLVFYGTLHAPYLLGVLLAVTAITYGLGLALDRCRALRFRRFIFWTGVVANVVILAVLKDLPSLFGGAGKLAAFLSLGLQEQPVKVLTTIGVSYFVFQALAYLIDVYLEVIKPERHFGYFFLSLAFFPKLLQGPIERSGDLLPQLKAKYEFRYDTVRYGILLFTWGLFKKVVIADRLGLYVDSIYNTPHAFTGLPLLVATYAYAFQIYLDFSGYTDMALGSAHLFNIRLTQNFNSPYLAPSVADFWRRWHISFSRWILDYIFKPLQMQWRGAKNWGTAAALLVTFLVSGIWHGTSWGFVVWGLLHGFYLACSVFYRPIQKKIHKALNLEHSEFLKIWQALITFHLVCLAWIFFRANTFGDALYIVRNIVRFGGHGTVFKASDYSNLLFLVAGAAFYILSKSWISAQSRLFGSKFRWVFYYVLFFIVFYLGTSKSNFIYFQF